jgi:REP-associated tyrosine transposase
MYEYRKLTAQEREEILLYRQKQGYPLHAPPHPVKGEGHFLITAANFEHQHTMYSHLRRTEFEVLALDVLKNASIDPIGWIVMPNHYHLLIHTGSFEKIPPIFQQLHGKTSREWNRIDNKLGRKVWFKYSDRKIRSERHFYCALNYIHYNPVKHRYVRSPEDWPWSSIHLYIQDHGFEWVRNKWESFPVLDFGKGWDD